jgi:hypothetical protein
MPVTLFLCGNIEIQLFLRRTRAIMQPTIFASQYLR